MIFLAYIHKIGKSSTPQSIVRDRNEHFFDTNLLENHVELKAKPSTTNKAKDNTLWDLLYKSNFIVPLLWERCHPCQELVKALALVTKVDSQNILNFDEFMILDLSHFAMYKALFQPDSSKP